MELKSRFRMQKNQLVTENSFEGRWESAFGYSLETVSGPAENII